MVSESLRSLEGASLVFLVYRYEGLNVINGGWNVERMTTCVKYCKSTVNET